MDFNVIITKNYLLLTRIQSAGTTYSSNLVATDGKKLGTKDSKLKTSKTSSLPSLHTLFNISFLVLSTVLIILLKLAMFLPIRALVISVFDFTTIIKIPNDSKFKKIINILFTIC